MNLINLFLDLVEKSSKIEDKPVLKISEDLPDKLKLISIDEKKQYLDPNDLVEFLKKGLYRVLIMDVRPKLDFDRSHMNLQLILNDEKKQQLINYMNLPNECIKSVSWAILDSLKSHDPASACLFAERTKYDYLILFDFESKFESMQPESSLGMLKRALFEFDLDACKNEPIILQGGWKSWLIYYPVLVSSPAAPLHNGQTEKKSIDKLFDFDYPEIDSTKKKTSPPVVIKPVETIPIPTSEVKIEIIAKDEEEKPVQVEQQPIVPPLINRSNKPETKSDSQIDPIKPSIP